MKIRTDFVTNSSSSSFIIGKITDHQLAVEDVFQTVQKIHKDFEDYVLNTAISKLKEFGCTFIDDPDVLDIEHDDIYNKYRWNNDEFDDACDALEDYTFCFNSDILKYKNYRDFVKSKNNFFYILDLSIDKTNADLEKYIEMFEYDENIRNSKSILLGWYYPYINEAFEHLYGCQGCSLIKCCKRRFYNSDPWYSKTRKSCLKTKKMIIKNKYCKNDAWLTARILGKIAILRDECAPRFPYWIINKLRKISNYSCDHMG